MKILVECKNLSEEDTTLAIKGLRAYMQMFDNDTQVHLTPETQPGQPGIEFLQAIEVLSKEIISVRDELKAHKAIGEYCPHNGGI